MCKTSVGHPRVAEGQVLEVGQRREVLQPLVRNRSVVEEQGPQGTYGDESVSGVRAVMSVVLAIAGLGILFLVAGMLVMRMR